MKRTLAGLTVLASLTGAAQAVVTVVFQDDDPLTPPNTANNVIVNTIDASVITGDLSRTAVGDVILTGNSKFVGFNPGDMTVPVGSDDAPFTFTMDYFVPIGTTLDENVAGSPDLFWLQISFDGGNNGSAGFLGAGAAGTGWNTITLNGTVTAGTTTINPLFVLADGGFGAGTPNGTGAGTALYVDNYLLTIDTIPEPSAALLGCLGLAGLAFRRRRG